MNKFDAAIAALDTEIESESAAIKEMRAALDKREEDLAVKVKARDMMKRFAGNDPQVPAPRPAPVQQPEQSELRAEEIDLAELDVETSSKRRTLIDDVRDVVRRFGRQEFTNAHVEIAMRRLNIEIAGKTPRSRISLAFAKLVEEGTLARTYIGGGNVPHKYRVRAMMTEEELSQVDAMNKAHTSDQPSATLDDQDQPSTDNVVKIA